MPAIAFAEPGIAEAILNIELAHDRGIEVTTSQKGPALSVSLSGPLELHAGCHPGRSGVVLFDSNSKEVGAYTTKCTPTGGRPEAIGYAVGSDTQEYE